MTVFLLPPMNAEIGRQLKQARQARSLTIEQAAQVMHIRVRYLQALEDGELEVWPSLTQARGFLRSYAAFLGLDERALLGSTHVQTSTPAQAAEIEPEIEKAAASPPAGGAEAMFVEIGGRLRRQRELLGIPLDEVVRHTHMRQQHLEALESGNMNDLPSLVQGRGMLNNYATFLGMDPEPLLLLFAEGLQARLASRQVERREKSVTRARRRLYLPTPLRRLFSDDILIGVTLIAIIIIVIFWGAIRIFALRSNQQATPTAPSIADILLATSTSTTFPTPETVTPTNPPAALPDAPAATAGDITPIPTSQEGAQTAGVQVYLTVLQRAWMRILVDGEVEFEGRILPGSAYTFVGEDSVEVLTGNGAALRLFFNQQDLGQLGQFGQVIDRIFTREGILMPTPTITPTPSPTPRFSPTPLLPPGFSTIPVLP